MYVIAPSPPLAAVALPIADAGVPPMQIVSPVVLIAPVMNAARTVTKAEPLFPSPSILLASVTETMVYVVVVVGLTAILDPEVYSLTVELLDPSAPKLLQTRTDPH